MNNASVAQSAEQGPYKPEVAGSIPAAGTYSNGDAPAWYGPVSFEIAGATYVRDPRWRGPLASALLVLALLWLAWALS